MLATNKNIIVARLVLESIFVAMVDNIDTFPTWAAMDMPIAHVVVSVIVVPPLKPSKCL
jgi:hypothetical protein